MKTTYRIVVDGWPTNSPHPTLEEVAETVTYYLPHLRVESFDYTTPYYEPNHDCYYTDVIATVQDPAHTPEMLRHYTLENVPAPSEFPLRDTCPHCNSINVVTVVEAGSRRWWVQVCHDCGQVNTHPNIDEETI